KHSGTSASVEWAEATTAGANASRHPAVHAWKVRSSRMYRGIGSEASSAAPTHASAWLTTKKTVPATITAATSLPESAASGGLEPANERVPAAAIIASAY